ncbi:MAG: hypothetical protein P8X88_03995, partial [Gammaproteobacteria bacterium]
MDIRKWILLVIFIVSTPGMATESVYQSPENFLEAAFSRMPGPKRLTLSGDLGKEVKNILGH